MRFTATFYPINLDLKIAASFQGTVDDRGVFFTTNCSTKLMGDPARWDLVHPRGIRRGRNRCDARVNKAFETPPPRCRRNGARFPDEASSACGNVKLLIGSIIPWVVFTLLARDGEHPMSMGHPRTVSVNSPFLRRWLSPGRLFIYFWRKAWPGGPRATIGIGGAWHSDVHGPPELTRGFLLILKSTPRIIATGGVVGMLLPIVAPSPRPSLVGADECGAGIENTRLPHMACP